MTEPTAVNTTKPYPLGKIDVAPAVGIAIAFSRHLAFGALGIFTLGFGGDAATASKVFFTTHLSLQSIHFLSIQIYEYNSQLYMSAQTLTTL